MIGFKEDETAAFARQLEDCHKVWKVREVSEKISLGLWHVKVIENILEANRKDIGKQIKDIGKQIKDIGGWIKSSTRKNKMFLLCGFLMII